MGKLPADRACIIWENPNYLSFAIACNDMFCLVGQSCDGVDALWAPRLLHAGYKDFVFFTIIRSDARDFGLASTFKNCERKNLMHRNARLVSFIQT